MCRKGAESSTESLVPLESVTRESSLIIAGLGCSKQVAHGYHLHGTFSDYVVRVTPGLYVKNMVSSVSRIGFIYRLRHANS